MLFTGIILFVVALAIELVIDYLNYLKKRTIRHKTKPVKRFFMLLPSMVCFIAAHHWSWYYSAGVVVIMEAFAWWLLFDGLYNVIRKFNWWFNGGHNDPTEPDSSTLDEWLSHLTDKQEAILKIGGTALFIIFYSLTLSGKILFT